MLPRAALVHDRSLRAISTAATTPTAAATRAAAATAASAARTSHSQDWLGLRPVFKVAADRVRVLHTPTEFYTALKARAPQGEERPTLESLRNSF